MELGSTNSGFITHTIFVPEKLDLAGTNLF